VATTWEQIWVRGNEAEVASGLAVSCDRRSRGCAHVQPARRDVKLGGMGPPPHVPDMWGPTPHQRKPLQNSPQIPQGLFVGAEYMVLWLGVTNPDRTYRRVVKWTFYFLCV
jgi:hypothetical protein